MIRYAYRLETKRIREPDFPYGDVKFLSPQEVAAFAGSLQDADIEKMLILYLDAQNKLICIQITMGTIDRQVIYPREIIKHALLATATGIILVHNHPSGQIDPSPEDKALTTSIQKACQLMDIRLLDHIITGEAGRFFSFAQSKIIDF